MTQKAECATGRCRPFGRAASYRPAERESSSAEPVIAGVPAVEQTPGAPGRISSSYADRADHHRGVPTWNHHRELWQFHAASTPDRRPLTAHENAIIAVTDRATGAAGLLLRRRTVDSPSADERMFGAGRPCTVVGRERDAVPRIRS